MKQYFVDMRLKIVDIWEDGKFSGRNYFGELGLYHNDRPSEGLPEFDDPDDVEFGLRERNDEEVEITFLTK